MLAIDPHLHDALTDLYLYALALDAEQQNVEKRMASAHAKSGELRGLQERHAEIASQLEVLRAMIAALRSRADPAGKHL